MRPTHPAHMPHAGLRAGRRRAWWHPVVTAALLAAGTHAGAALPAPPTHPAVSRNLLAVQADVGPAAAAAAARQSTGGRVLGVSGRKVGDRVIYRVRVLLPGGRVRTVIVDGASGEVRG